MAQVDHSLFGTSYSDWKSWNPQDFGTLSSRDRATYDRELGRLIRGRAKPVVRVLEIGFGNGGFLTYCKQRGWAALGTEVSASLLSAARDKGYDVRHADTLETDVDGGFDIIAMFDVLEHIPQEAMNSLLIAVKRKLAPDGTILARFPNADSWLGNQNFNGDPTHVTAIGHFKLRYFCERAGLEVRAFHPEVRLGFDGGIAKGLHALVARPLVAVIASLTRMLYFPRSKIVLGSANVVAHLVQAR